MSDRRDETDSVLRRIAAAPPKAPSPRALSAVWKPGAILLDRYRILHERGRGGMGRVFAARDQKLDRDVAIKVLLAEPGDPRALERFEKEARAASRINHPNIATVYDVVATDDGPGIVSELLDGATLRDRLAAGGAASPDEARLLGLQLAEGLTAAHEGGVVHRDLKPSNLFVTRDGRLKILDFGLAKLVELDGKAPVTHEGIAAGTVGYMSPEQVRCATVDARSDLFAAGIVLYELVAGRRPFEGASRYEIESRIVERDPDPLPQSVPASLSAIIRRCLEKAPERRFQSARELAAALGGADASAFAAPRPPRRRRVRALVIAAAAIAAASVAYPLAHRAPRLRPADPPSIAVLPFRDLSPSSGQAFLSDGIAEDILTALARVDGLRVAGRTSSFSFRDTRDDARTIGQKLGVGALLEGSVRRVGERVRISARLVSAADGYQLWAEDFDRGTADLLAVEDELARDIVGALKVKLLSGGRDAATNRGSKSPEAYTDYLLARRQSLNNGKAGLEDARGSIERALRRDPQFAAGWAEYASILFHIVFTDLDRAASEAMLREAAAAADKAIALDPELPDGYIIRSAIRSDTQWDLRGAQADLERALALSPNDAATLSAKAHLLLYFSHRLDEAIAMLKRVTELEPLDDGPWTFLGYAYRNSRRFAEAKVAFRRALEISPENGMVQYFVAEIDMHEGHVVEALRVFDAIGHPFEGFRLNGRAVALEALGRRAESRAALAELEKLGADESPLFVGNTYAELGDIDRAFFYYERAFAHHDVALVDIISSPFIDNVRRDPRYAALVRRMGLIDDEAPPGR